MARFLGPRLIATFDEQIDRKMVLRTKRKELQVSFEFNITQAPDYEFKYRILIVEDDMISLQNSVNSPSLWGYEVIGLKN